MTTIVTTPNATPTRSARPHLSHSQITTYRQCPRRYQLERGIGLARPALQAPSEPLMIGVAAHAALEAFCVALRDGALPLTLDELRQRALDELATELSIRDPRELVSAQERKQLRARLLHLMAQFYNAVLRGWLRESADGDAEIIGVEESFTLPLLDMTDDHTEVRDTGWDFTGRVDVRRALLRRGGGPHGGDTMATEIADFKTASKPWTPGKEHDLLDAGGQAAAYAWAEQAVSGALPERVVFHVVSASVFASNGGNRLYPTTRYESRPTTPGERQVAVYREMALDTRSRMEGAAANQADGDSELAEEAYPPKPSPLCGWCGVLAHCEVGQRWLKSNGRTATELIQRHMAAVTSEGSVGSSVEAV